MPVAGLFLNGLWMGLLVLVVSSTARRLGDQRAARIAALIAVFLPPFIWWGSQLLREASMWLLIALVADTAVRVALDGLVWRRGVWLLVLFLAMVTMRAPVAAVLAIALGLGLVLVRAPRPGDHLRRIVLIGGSVSTRGVSPPPICRSSESWGSGRSELRQLAEHPGGGEYWFWADDGAERICPGGTVARDSSARGTRTSSVAATRDRSGCLGRHPRPGGSSSSGPCADSVRSIADTVGWPGYCSSPRSSFSLSWR